MLGILHAEGDIATGLVFGGKDLQEMLAAAIINARWLENRKADDNFCQIENNIC